MVEKTHDDIYSKLIDHPDKLPAIKHFKTLD